MCSVKMKILDRGTHILRGEDHYQGQLWELKLSEKAVMAPVKKEIKRPNRRYPRDGREWNNPGGVYTFIVNGTNHILETGGDFCITPYNSEIVSLWGVKIAKH